MLRESNKLRAAPEPEMPVDKPPEAQSKMFRMRNTPELKESIRIVALNQRTMPEKMVTEMLEKFVAGTPF